MIGWFVDTSTWSHAVRRSRPSEHPSVRRLAHAVAQREEVATTGLVLQELLVGVRSPAQRLTVLDHVSSVELLMPGRSDHLVAADLATECQEAGVQLKAVDALIASLCIAHDRVLLTADRDFEHAARIIPLQVWRPAA